jgi:hypothetical protein
MSEIKTQNKDEQIFTYETMEDKPKFKTKNESLRYLQRLWGPSKFHSNLKKAQNLLHRFAAPEMIAFIDQSSMGDFAPLIEAAHNINLERENFLAGSENDPSMVKSADLKAWTQLGHAVSDSYDQYTKDVGQINEAFPSDPGETFLP